MKNFTLILLLLTPLFSFGQNNDPNLSQRKNIGAIGDVKYSILEPPKFMEVNGSGWVIMAGQNITNSDLHEFSGISILPDSRGQFIRSMNLGRNSEEGDTQGDRQVGTSQLDSFQGHQLEIGVLGSPGQLPGFRSGPNNGPSFKNALGIVELGEYGTPRVGMETRPRNITLYTYIKINN